MTSVEICKKICEELTDYQLHQEKNEALCEHDRWLASKTVECCKNLVIMLQNEEDNKRLENV